MREAYELAYVAAMKFLKARPLTVCLDEISFRQPVRIGSILTYDAEVVYSEGFPHSTFQVQIIASVEGMDKKKDIATIFYFTFSALDGTKVPRLLPKTYSDAMKFIEGKRRKDEGIASKKIQEETFKYFD
jgi:acyl-coenzyme A thioesterase 9